MDIFPKLLGETEFKNFTEEDYEKLADVLDDVTANYIVKYMKEPNADADIVSAIQKNLGDKLHTLTFHIELKNSGILDLVNSLSPESLAISQIDLDELIDRLSFLEKNQDSIRSSIPGRTSAACAKFESAMHSVVTRIIVSGGTPTYPDIPKRLAANRFLFYSPGEKEHYTGVGVLNSKKRQWTLTLNGARWLKYCNDNNIPFEKRSAF